MINNTQYSTLLGHSQVLHNSFDEIDQPDAEGKKDGVLDEAELQRIIDTTDDAELKAAAQFFLRHADALAIVDGIISGDGALSKQELGAAANGAGFAGFLKLGLDANFKYYFSIEGQTYSIAKDGEGYKAYDSAGNVVDDDVQIRNDGTPGFVEISNEKGLIDGLEAGESLYVGGRSASADERLVLKGESGKTANGVYAFIDALTGTKGEVTLEDKPAGVAFDDWLQSKLDEGYTFKFSDQNETYSIKKVGDYYKAFKVR